MKSVNTDENCLRAECDGSKHRRTGEEAERFGPLYQCIWCKHLDHCGSGTAALVIEWQFTGRCRYCQECKRAAAA